MLWRLDELAEDYVQEHLQQGEAYGCVGKPESYSAEEFADFWLAGAAGDFCRRHNVKPTSMHAALIKAWNSRDNDCSEDALNALRDELTD